MKLISLTQNKFSKHKNSSQNWILRRTTSINFFTKNLEYWAITLTIRQFIEFLKTQTRPNVLDLENPEFISAFDQFIQKDNKENMLDEDEEEEI